MTKTLSLPEDVARNYQAIKDDPRHQHTLEQANVAFIVENWAEMQPLDQKLTAGIINACANGL